MKNYGVLSLCLSFILSANLVWGSAAYFIPTEVGTSAGSVRLGNIEGFSDTSSSTLENPAGLYRLNKFSANLFSTTFMEEINYQNFSVAARLPVGVLGFGYMSAGVDGIPNTGSNGSDASTKSFYVLNTFSYQNRLFKVAYEFSQNENLHLGFSGTYYSTTLGTVSGSGFNADAGIEIESGPLVFSIAAKNIIPSLKVNYSDTTSANYSQSEELFLETFYGAKYKLDEFTFYGQIDIQNSNKKLLKGLAVDYSPSFVPYLHLSLGYKEFVVLQAVKNNITAGLGLSLSGVNFDYAYERSDHILYNNKHYFSVGFSF